MTIMYNCQDTSKTFSRQLVEVSTQTLARVRVPLPGSACSFVAHREIGNGRGAEPPGTPRPARDIDLSRQDPSLPPYRRRTRIYRLPPCS